MAYQVPKSNHPWRRYANKLPQSANPQPEQPQRQTKPVRMFVTELVSSWETIEVVASTASGSGHCSLVDLSQEKQAAWLANMLRRMYA